jgi:hypothetical protein
MTWLLVLILLRADGTSSETGGLVFRSERECQRYGQAWEAMANRRYEGDIAFFRCKARDTAASPERTLTGR